MVAGGSVSGLLAAREAASAGFTVKVFEEDREIGVPEKCDGLVSVKGLTAIGVLPSRRCLQNEVRRAVLHSPGGLRLEIDAAKQRVVVLDRSALDRDLAREAEERGVEVEVGGRVTGLAGGEHVMVATREGRHRARFAVDARGCASLLESGCRGVLQAARYEVHGGEFERDTVELFFDQRTTPGFFTWVIPIDEETAKVGAAGASINTFEVLDAFVKKMGSSVVKRVAAPIAVGGPLPAFVHGRIITVGDAAGQAKPTTGGGIYTGGLGGVLAGQAIVKSLQAKSSKHLKEYEDAWRGVFGREFRAMKRVRRALGRMDNRVIDRLFGALAESGVLEGSAPEGDFDFHSAVLLRALGVKGVLEVLGAAVTAEVRRLLSLPP